MISTAYFTLPVLRRHLITNRAHGAFLGYALSGLRSATGTGAPTAKVVAAELGDGSFGFTAGELCKPSVRGGRRITFVVMSNSAL